MLKQISIENMAIVSEASVVFESGFTAITGDTGAGKSLLMDALLLVFGEKGSPKEFLRTGTNKGFVEIVLDLENNTNKKTVQSQLQMHGVEVSDDELNSLSLYREFNEKTSRARINGVPVPIKVVSDIRPLLVDVHGQHELTNLFRASSQREYLDQLAGEPVHTLKQQVAQVYHQWKALDTKIEQLENDAQRLLHELEFKRFQLNELDSAQLTDPTEDDTLASNMDRLRNAEALMASAGECVFLLNEGHSDEPSVMQLLSRLEKKLSQAVKLDSSLEPMNQHFISAQEQLREMAYGLTAYQEALELNPDVLAETRDRLDLLERLKRKYAMSLTDVMAFHESLSHEVNEDGSAIENLDALKAERDSKATHLSELCQTLRTLRNEAATALKTNMVAYLERLMLPSVRFETQFDDIGFTADGQDKITFLFSANPGQPLKPLSDVASGGELSRFLLAMKALIATNESVGTLVFDEIDTGLSGPAVKSVAQTLVEMGTYRQVVTITHQPIIAASADHHHHVEKQVVSKKGKEAETQVRIQPLSDTNRRLSILSRLLHGKDMDNNDHDALASVTEFLTDLQTDASQWKTQQKKGGQSKRKRATSKS